MATWSSACHPVSQRGLRVFMTAAHLPGPRADNGVSAPLLLRSNASTSSHSQSSATRKGHMKTKDAQTRRRAYKGILNPLMGEKPETQTGDLPRSQSMLSSRTKSEHCEAGAGAPHIVTPTSGVFPGGLRSKIPPAGGNTEFLQLTINH